MDEDEIIKAVIDRYSPDELCELLNLTTTDMVERFYDEILDNEEIRYELGIDG